MQSHYEINVSLDGQHLFATAERSLTNSSKMKSAYLQLKKRFPVSEGFKVEVTYWKVSGQTLSVVD